MKPLASEQIELIPADMVEEIVKAACIEMGEAAFKEGFQKGKRKGYQMAQKDMDEVVMREIKVAAQLEVNILRVVQSRCKLLKPPKIKKVAHDEN